MKNWFGMNWLKLVAIVMLAGAFASLSFLPYAYFQLMNWAVVGASLVSIRQAYQRANFFAAWVFAFVAVIFNPLAPIYLRNDIWQIADVAAALLFFVSLFMVKAKKVTA